jgi:tetratricopeptide (TPR) repeat protein
MALPFDSSMGLELPGQEWAWFLHEAVDHVLHTLAQNPEWQSDPGHRAGQHTLRAIDQMFSLTRSDIAGAERNLDAAYAIKPNATILAWRAYSTVFRLDNPGSVNHRSLCEEAEDYTRRALELDPYNGLALALLAHVSSFVLREFARAADFIERAQALRCEHVMAHDAEALLNFYTGNMVRARAAARRAETAGRHLPYRYCFATSLCMIEALSGNFTEAIAHGERALSLQPASGRPYAPAVRYLGASYSAIGRPEAALRTFGRLKAVDSSFSSRAIDPRTYPTPSIAAAVFIREGLQRVAL